jgi:uncharacterized membrane protein
MTDDKLTWWEEAPLVLLVGAQVLIVFEWYTGFTVWPFVTAIFGVVAAGALDAAVVASTRGRRLGRRSIWGWLTAASAALFSALVSLNHYNVLGAWGEGWLHAAYPVVSFIYAQHLAQSRASREQANSAPEQAAHTTVNVLQVAGEPQTLRAFIQTQARAMLAEQPALTHTDIAARLGTSRATVQRALEGDED